MGHNENRGFFIKIFSIVKCKSLPLLLNLNSHSFKFRIASETFNSANMTLTTGKLIMPVLNSNLTVLLNQSQGMRSVNKKQRNSPCRTVAKIQIPDKKNRLRTGSKIHQR